VQDEVNCCENLKGCSRVLGSQKVKINASGGILYPRVLQDEMAFWPILANASQDCGYLTVSSNIPGETKSI
jgi:hypothetical protein